MEKLDVEAVYESGTLKLPHTLPLEAGQKVTITIHATQADPQRRRALIQWKGRWEDLEELILSDENTSLEPS